MKKLDLIIETIEETEKSANASPVMKSFCKQMNILLKEAKLEILTEQIKFVQEVNKKLDNIKDSIIKI